MWYGYWAVIQTLLKDSRHEARHERFLPFNTRPGAQIPVENVQLVSKGAYWEDPGGAPNI